MRLGIGSYTYVWAVGVPGYPAPERPLTAFDLLERAAESGVQLVQIADNLPLDRLPQSELDALARRAVELGIDIEIGASGLDRERLLTWLGLAERFRSPILRVVIDTERSHPTSDEAIAMIAGVLPDFERVGVILAIENHDRFTSRTLLDIVRRAESASIGICFDTANSVGCLERAEEVLETLGEHIVNVHIKDYSLFRQPHHKGFVVEGRPAGKGQLDAPKLLDRVKGFGRDPNVIAELWPPPQGTLEETLRLEEDWAAESVRYLRRFIEN